MSKIDSDHPLYATLITHLTKRKIKVTKTNRRTYRKNMHTNDCIYMTSCTYILTHRCLETHVYNILYILFTIKKNPIYKYLYKQKIK